MVQQEEHWSRRLHDRLGAKTRDPERASQLKVSGGLRDGIGIAGLDRGLKFAEQVLYGQPVSLAKLPFSRVLNRLKRFFQYRGIGRRRPGRQGVISAHHTAERNS
jgi:hypothetical protein